MLGLIEIAPAVQRALARQAREVGQARQRDVELARRAADAEVADRLHELVREVLLVDELQEAALRIGRRHDHLGRGTRRRWPARRRRRGRPCTITLSTAALVRISTPSARADDGDRRRHAARAVLGESPGAERAVDLAHVMVQQHVGRARRTRAEVRADDAARRLGALQRVELEPFLEQVGRRLRHQLGDAVDLVLAQRAAVLAELEQALHVAPAERRRVGRHQPDDRLDRLGRARHHARVLVVGLRIPRRMTVDLAARQVVIVPAREVIAVVERRDRARQRQDLQAVPRQLQVADDLGPQQAHHVREFGEAVARKDFFRDGGAADDFAPLQHADLLAGAREVRGRDHAVVAGADDEGIVGIAGHVTSSSTRVRRTAARPRSQATAAGGAPR